MRTLTEIIESMPDECRGCNKASVACLELSFAERTYSQSLNNGQRVMDPSHARFLLTLADEEVGEPYTYDERIEGNLLKFFGDVLSESGNDLEEAQATYDNLFKNCAGLDPQNPGVCQSPAAKL